MQEHRENVNGKENTRQLFLDVLRIAATLAVVMMHTVSGVLNGYFDMRGYERRVKAFQALIDATSWSVPIFLMISGFLFLDPDRRMTWKDALFKYCRRIFLTLVLFGIPYSLLELVGYLRYFEWWMVPRAIKNTAMGRSWSHMWYLYLILILYAVTPLIKKVLERLPRRVLYGGMAVLLLGCGVLPYVEMLLKTERMIRLPEQGIYVFYYLCGYLFAIRKASGEKKERTENGELQDPEGQSRKAEKTCCLVGFVLILLLEMGSRFLPGYEVIMAYGYPPTVLAALLLFDAGWVISREKRQEKVSERVSSFLKKNSALCFGIYLIHPAFLNLFYKILKISIMNFRFYVGVPLFFGIALLGSGIATWVLRLIPPLRKYVL